MNLPDFSYERKANKKGFLLIAGVDEVGRGAFAGPVVAGCVAFDLDYIRSVKTINVLINDSKKMSSKSREISDKWIKSNCITWGIGEASVGQINKHGIKKATEMAFRKSVKNTSERLGKSIDFLLIDAFYIPNVHGMQSKNQMPIIDGDSLSVSIAAASIIAKVHRDKLMEKLSQNQKNRKYLWHKNKGYGTKEHIEAIKRHGICGLHRKTFVRNILS